MPKVRLTLSANAGVSLEIGGYKVLVDTYHEAAESGFSALSPVLAQRVLNSDRFLDPDCICYTHCHGDHYSRRLTALAREHWPKAKLLLPEAEFADQITVSGNRFSWRKGDLVLRFIKLPHEGAQYAGVKHYGLIVSIPGFRVLLSGDCAVAAPELAGALEGERIDLAVMDFPWASLKKGKQFLETVIRPGHLLLYHLPFAEDDLNGYREAAALAQKKSPVADTRLLWNPLQTEIYEW